MCVLYTRGRPKTNFIIVLGSRARENPRLLLTASSHFRGAKLKPYPASVVPWRLVRAHRVQTCFAGDTRDNNDHVAIRIKPHVCTTRQSSSLDAGLRFHRTSYARSCRSSRSYLALPVAGGIRRGLINRRARNDYIFTPAVGFTKSYPISMINFNVDANAMPTPQVRK